MLRAEWHRRTTFIPLSWLLLAAVLAPLKVEGWILIHVILLGGVTNAIVIWARHFTLTLLFLPDRHNHRDESIRLFLLNLGIVGILIHEFIDIEALMWFSVALILAAIVWVISAFVTSLRKALPARFTMTVYAYLIATVFLFSGVLLGVVMGDLDLSDDLKARLILSHVALNVLGWIGITIMATLVTLGPTMLRTQMVPGAEVKASKSVAPLSLGVVLTAFGFGLELRWLAIAGLVSYLYGIWLSIAPLIENLRAKKPTSFATWSTTLGTLWLMVVLTEFIAMTWNAVNAEALASGAEALLPGVIFGGVVQILLGALSYLIPAMSGGGPAAVRARNEIADKWMRPRLIVANGSLLALALPVALGPIAITVAAITSVVTASLIIASGRITPAL